MLHRLTGILLLAVTLTACGNGAEHVGKGHGAALEGQQYVAMGDSSTAAPGVGRTIGD
ncbi:hypothetical protein GCM10028801_11470 [Nocardioides maradonensis]